MTHLKFPSRLLLSNKAWVQSRLELKTTYFRKLSNEKYPRDKLAIHEVFPRVPAHVAFHNKKLRDEFNQGLAQIKKSGKHQAIIDQYIK